MEIKGREGARGGEEMISRKVTKGQSVKRICCKMIFMARGAIKKCKRSSNQQKQSQNQLNFASNLASHGNKSSNREGNAIEKLNFNLLSAAELFPLSPQKHTVKSPRRSIETSEVIQLITLNMQKH
jgi:hypothetical protein